MRGARVTLQPPAATRLAKAALRPYIGSREVGAGRRLANLVRSGRKQPQRAPLGSMSSLSPETPDVKERTWQSLFSSGPGFFDHLICPARPDLTRPAP